MQSKYQTAEYKTEAHLIYKYLYSKEAKENSISSYIKACEIKKIPRIEKKVLDSIIKFPSLLYLYDQALMFNNEHPLRKKIFLMSTIGECENYEFYYKNENIILFLIKSIFITIKSALLFLPGIILLKWMRA